VPVRAPSANEPTLFSGPGWLVLHLGAGSLVDLLDGQ
jgi:hypothetical protein